MNRNEKIIVNVSSYERIDSLILSLESIYDQCDIINVCLNNHYGDIPSYLLNPKINLTFTDNSKGDAFKFLNLINSDGYYFTIDDDLIYPKNYVEYMISKCKEYNNESIITLHGRNFNELPIKSYYKSHKELFHYSHVLKNDVMVQYGGTGVMCFHTDLIKLNINYFKYPNMADVWIGYYAKKNNIPIICVKHNSDFIKTIPQKTTIHNQKLNNDTIQTQIVNGGIFDKNFSLIIPTFNNVPFLTECFDSIVESIKDLDCEVLVGIDNCIETKKYIQSHTFDNRFKFYFFNKNVGPYVIKNTLSKLSNSDYLLFFDSDDIMTENMIGLVLSYKKTNKVIKPMYLDFVGNKNNIKYEIKKTTTYGEGVFAISKEVFLNVNGFQGWRCAADSEFFSRLYKGNIRPFVSQNICFYRRQHPNSLTQHPDTNFSSKKRSDYTKMFSKKLVLERLITEEYTEIIVKYHQPLNLDNNSHEIIQTSYDLVTNVINNFNPNKEIKSNVNYDLINQIINNPKIYSPSKEKPLIQHQPKNRNELNQNRKGGMAEQVRKMKMPKSRPNNMIPNVFGGRKKS